MSSQLLFSLFFQTDPCAVRRGHVLSSVRHHRAEEGRMRLAALHCLPH